MSYSDFDMRVAARIAYMDIPPASVISNPDMTIRDYLTGSDSEKLIENLNKKDPELYDLFMNSEYGEWKIVYSVDKNSDDGFCGCVIDTGDGNAIVGFRGSETGSTKIVVDDWAVADAGLLNNELTKQQESAVEFFGDVELLLKDRYQSFSLVGHSLGGGLASHVALNASDQMVAKFDRVVSLDGPGVSQEYLNEYASQIEKNAHLIEHYHFSLVGSGALKNIPGSKYVCIDSDGGNIPFLNLFKRHNLKSIQYDENGNFKRGLPDPLSLMFKGFSNAMDENTRLEGLWSVFELAAIMNNPYSQFEFGKDMFREMFEFAFTKAKEYSEYKTQQNAVARMADFSVYTSCLEATTGLLNESSSQLSVESSDVVDVNSQISKLLKAASLYTLSYKLKKTASNLEKLGSKTSKMSDAAAKILTEFVNQENNISSNA